ncbi:response regulator transcription factor [Bacillus sp. SCS-151]|uniref:response regulator transcription factor n=1 Tax=Nanhaiella sioensis TaxID=3115293 RepID=UPI00397C6D32
MNTVLLVEDEVPIARVLRAYLSKEGFQVEHTKKGKDALQAFEVHRPSLVLLDIMLPDVDGWHVLQMIRKTSSCPVIMITALGDINQRLKGLNNGADDYISKPFVAEEVVARVHAVLRRSKSIEDHTVKHFGNLAIDISSHQILLNGTEVHVTPRDLALLIFLAEHTNQTFTREHLIEQVWGIDYEGSDRAVDLAIKRLRKSLKEWDSSVGEIKTLRGMGYQLSVYE